MDLSKASTRELVEELAKREAVEKITAEPYQEYKAAVGEKRSFWCRIRCCFAGLRQKSWRIK